MAESTDVGFLSSANRSSLIGAPSKVKRNFFDRTVGGVLHGGADAGALLSRGIVGQGLDAVLPGDPFAELSRSLEEFKQNNPQYAPEEVDSVWDLLASPGALLHRVTTGLPYLGTIMGLFLIPYAGPSIAAGLAFGVESRRSYESGLAMGLGEDDATTLGVVGGTVNTILNMIPAGFGIRVMKGAHGSISRTLVRNAFSTAKAWGQVGKAAQNVAWQTVTSALSSQVDDLSALGLVGRPLPEDWKDTFLQAAVVGGVNAEAMGFALHKLGGEDKGNKWSPKKHYDIPEREGLFAMASKDFAQGNKYAMETVGAVDAVFNLVAQREGKTLGQVYAERFASGKLDAGGEVGEVMFQKTKDVMGFYLKSEEALDGLGRKVKEVPSEDIRAFLQKKGVGKDELRWTGLGEVLDAGPKVKVDDLRSTLRKGMGKLVEVKLGEDEVQKWDGEREAVQTSLEVVREEIEGLKPASEAKTPEEGMQLLAEQDRLAEHRDALLRSREEMYEKQSAASPQYSEDQYNEQRMKRTNYHEFVMLSPEAGTTLPSHFQDVSMGERMLFHVRASEYVTPEGLKGLHVEEVQSDRLQSESKVKAVVKKRGGVADEFSGPLGEGGNWQDAAVKRMLMFAVENGIDTVTIAGADAQKGRWGADEKTIKDLKYVIETARDPIKKAEYEKTLDEITQRAKGFDQNYGVVLPAVLLRWAKRHDPKVKLEQVEVQKGSKRYTPNEIGEMTVRLNDLERQISQLHAIEDGGGRLNPNQLAEMSILQEEHSVLGRKEREATQPDTGLVENGVRLTPQAKDGIAREGFPLYQSNRASTTILRSGQALIQALRMPDASSLVHELGHVFRRMLPTDDLKALETSLRVKDGKWTTPNEESWARMVERYMREGKTPSPNLESTFDFFRQAIRGVYKQVKALGTDSTITPTTRGILDRMFYQDSSPVASARGRLSAALAEVGEFEKVQKEAGKVAKGSSPTSKDVLEGVGEKGVVAWKVGDRILIQTDPTIPPPEGADGPFGYVFKDAEGRAYFFGEEGVPTLVNPRKVGVLGAKASPSPKEVDPEVALRRENLQREVAAAEGELKLAQQRNARELAKEDERLAEVMEEIGATTWKEPRSGPIRRVFTQLLDQVQGWFSLEGVMNRRGSGKILTRLAHDVEAGVAFHGGRFINDVVGMLDTMGYRGARKWGEGEDWSALRRLTDDLGVPDEGKVKADTPEALALRGMVKEILDYFTEESVRLGMKRDTGGGKMEPIRRSKYSTLPRLETLRGFEMFMTRGGDVWEAFSKRVVELNPGVKLEDVVAYAEGIAKILQSPERTLGTLDYSRSIRYMPDRVRLGSGEVVDVFHTDPREVFPRMIQRMARRVSWVEQFGQGGLKDVTTDTGVMRKAMRALAGGDEGESARIAKELGVQLDKQGRVSVRRERGAVEGELARKAAVDGVDLGVLGGKSWDKLVKLAKTFGVETEVSGEVVGKWLKAQDPLTMSNRVYQSLKRVGGEVGGVRVSDTSRAILLEELGDRLLQSPPDRSVYEKLKVAYTKEGGNPGDFDDVVRLVNGKPLVQVSQTPLAKLGRFVGSVLGASQTSLSALPNMFQTGLLAQLVGVGKLQAAWRDVVLNRNLTESQVRAMTGIGPKVFRWVREPGGGLDNISALLMSGVGEATFQNRLTNFNNVVSGKVGVDLVESWRAKKATTKDISTMRFLNLSGADIQNVLKGDINDRLASKIVRNAVDTTQFVSAPAWVKGRTENLPLMKALFAYMSYVSGMGRTTIALGKGMVEDVKSGDPGRMFSALKRGTVYLASVYGVGTVSMLVRQAFRGDLRQEKEMEQDLTKRITMPLLEAGILGPVQRFTSALGHDGGDSGRTILGMMPHLNAVVDLVDTLVGRGKFGDFSPTKRAAEFALKQTPLAKAVAKWADAVAYPDHKERLLVGEDVRRWEKGVLGRESQVLSTQLNPEYWEVYEYVSRNDVDGARVVRDRMIKEGMAKGKDVEKVLDGLRASLMGRRPIPLRGEEIIRYLEGLDDSKRSRYLGVHREYMVLVDQIAPGRAAMDAASSFFTRRPINGRPTMFGEDRRAGVFGGD